VGWANNSGREGVSLLMPSALRVVCAICLLRSGVGVLLVEVGVLLVEVGVSCLGQGPGCLSCRGQGRGGEGVAHGSRCGGRSARVSGG
jgi:hypothetical protein